MSLILEGIDLPKDKDRIYLLIEGDKCFNALDPVQKLAEVIPIPTPHGRLIDMDDLSSRMYHEAFETDTSLQKWDGGCWIRYKMFENYRDSAPTILEAEE